METAVEKRWYVTVSDLQACTPQTVLDRHFWGLFCFFYQYLAIFPAVSLYPLQKRAYSALHPQALIECSPLDFRRSSILRIVSIPASLHQPQPLSPMVDQGGKHYSRGRCPGSALAMPWRSFPLPDVDTLLSQRTNINWREKKIIFFLSFPFR